MGSRNDFQMCIPSLVQDCPKNCNHAGACVLWHDPPFSWYGDDVPAPAPEAAADLAAANERPGRQLDVGSNGMTTAAGPVAARIRPAEYPQCVCFPGLAVSRSTKFSTFHLVNIAITQAAPAAEGPASPLTQQVECLQCVCFPHLWVSALWG